jgi:hypothetical protein
MARLRSLIAFGGILVLCLSALTARGQNTNLSVHTDFEGASAEIVEVDTAAQTIRLKPGGDPDRGWPVWWYVRVDGIAPGSDVTIVVQNPEMGDWARPRRATYSLDRRTWRHTAPGTTEGKSISYTQTIPARQAWFAWGPPFTPTDGSDLVHRLARRCAGAEAFVLTRSPEGRPIPALRSCCGDTPTEDRPVVWIQARQHAWESGSSWVGRGFAEWLMGNDPAAQRLRAAAEIVFVPVMDVDNAATGNGGKNQTPHDHNRDWTDDPVHPAVAAAQKKLRAYARDDRLSLFVDLHNPSFADDSTFVFTPPFNRMDAPTQKAFQRFIATNAEYIQSPIPFTPDPREMGPDYGDRWDAISNHWVVQHSPEGVVGLTLETPWNTRHSTTDGYMVVGRQLGQAIATYITNGS